MPPYTMASPKTQQNEPEPVQARPLTTAVPPSCCPAAASARLGRITIPRRAEVVLISPLARLESTLQKRRIELAIAESFARGMSVDGELAGRSEEIIVEMVMGWRRTEIP